MNRIIKLWVLRIALGASVICSIGGGLTAAAQDAPGGSGVVTPDPATCQAEPRTIDELVAIFDGATITEPVAAESVDVPTGSPGSVSLTEGVSTTVNEAFACLNAGDFLRFFSLLTENAIVTAFSWMGEELATNGTPAELTQPAPLPADQRQSVVAVADMRSLGVDRAGAFVVFLDPASGSESPDVLHLSFVRDGGDWLIDDVIEFSNQ